MKPTLIIIEDDYVRSDLIAAICVDGGDEEKSAKLIVHLIGSEVAIEWWFESWDEAENAQAEAARVWFNAISSS
jgi:hypothetical protein